MSSSAAPDPALGQLRAIAYRITALQPSDLARQVPHLAFQLAPCKNILSQAHHASTEAYATVHQIKTRVSSLLQERTEESRFVGVALVKTLVDLGGWEILHTCAAWVRSMVTFLARPSDMTVTKRMCLLALVRIFQLTHDYDNLVREITTPNLPPYVTACLTVLQLKDGQSWSAKQQELLKPIFTSWSTLMPKHPTIFRPFISQIRKILAKITTADVDATIHNRLHPTVSDAARRVQVLLHGSATKTGDLEDRDCGLSSALRLARTIAQRLMTTLYGSDNARQHSARNSFEVNGDLEAISDDALILGLIKQLRLVSGYITTLSTKSSNLPIGNIVALIQFLTAAPTARAKSTSTLTKNARQSLLLDLPTLHLECLRVASSILTRLGTSATSIARDILDCAVDALEGNPANEIIRETSFVVAEQSLKLIGHALTDKTIRPVHIVIKQCCKEFMPADMDAEPQPKTTNGRNVATAINPNAMIGVKRKGVVPRSATLEDAALRLLTTVLTEVPASALPAALRTEIERTAILARKSNTLIASVLNPRAGLSSLLPFAAQLSDSSPALEALLRPRVPVVHGSGGHDVHEDDDESMVDEPAAQIDNRWTATPAEPAPSLHESLSERKRDHAEPEEREVANAPVKRVRLDLEAYLPVEEPERPAPSIVPTLATQSDTVLPKGSGDASAGMGMFVADDNGLVHNQHVSSQASIAHATNVDSDSDDDDEDFVVPLLVMNDDI